MKLTQMLLLLLELLLLLDLLLLELLLVLLYVQYNSRGTLRAPVEVHD